MNEIRLIIRCLAHPQEHAKKLRMQGMDREQIEMFAGLLCGTSPLFIYKPGPKSPIGKCATCGGPLKWEIEEMESEEKPIDLKSVVQSLTGQSLNPLCEDHHPEADLVDGAVEISCSSCNFRMTISKESYVELIREIAKDSNGGNDANSE